MFLMLIIYKQIPSKHDGFKTTNNKVACFVALGEFCKICFGNEWDGAYGPGDHLHRDHVTTVHSMATIVVIAVVVVLEDSSKHGK
jgi:hypothetical protein